MKKLRLKVKLTIFYVYILYYEDGFTPMYVGKGKGNRLNDHEKLSLLSNKHTRHNPYLYSVIRTALVSGDKVIKEKIFEDLTELEAFKLEVELILGIGRKDIGTGPLLNRSNGGDGNCGVIRTEEHNMKISSSLKGQERSEASKLKMSIAAKNRKPVTEEFRLKMSKITKGRPKSEETRLKLSLANKGKKKGPMSEEQKLKQSLVTKGRPGRVHSLEERMQQSARQKGQKYSEERKRNLWGAASKRYWELRRLSDPGRYTMIQGGQKVMAGIGGWGVSFYGFGGGSEVPGQFNITVSGSPPISPDVGDLWWDSDEANMYIWFNDGTSSQWVPATSSVS